MQYQKVKSVSKMVLPKGKALESLILDTMNKCSEIVGATLGPGGMSVLIERQEQNMPPMVTKDGVTVFKNLGFDDSTSQIIMEAARDSAIRTASEAGDGTTTATILANAFVKATNAFCKENPRVSPQRVVRTVENAFKTIIEPFIQKHSKEVNLQNNKPELHAVAKVSANGDVPLADAVIECFDLVGDEGNVTILEFNGPSKYEVDRIDGFGIPIGFEDCCGPFYQKFINDTGTQSCQLDNPILILYFGQIKDVSICAKLFETIIDAANGKVPNVVLVTTGFSETVLAHLAVNFSAANKNINVYPLLVPMSPIKTGQFDFLTDLAALSGGKIFDPIQKPLDSGRVEDVGVVSKFEATRFRSNIIIDMDEPTEIRIFNRVDELHQQLGSVATSELDKQLLRERIGKLTGGIAKLKIFGSSTGELREKRDRAEDAICAVRGALKHGALPAGGHTLVNLSKYFLQQDVDIYKKVISIALLEPVKRLFENSGMTLDECLDCINQYEDNKTFDLLEGKFVDPFKAGLLDSTPAVLEAIRNSMSIATLLGTCGGTIAYKRDHELERAESRDTRNFLKDIEEPV
jgi:chaperonin GroEL